MLIAGLDEAVRGPVLGPMAIAIAVLDSETSDYMSGIGVKDSKLLDIGTMRGLEKEIKEKAAYYKVVVIDNLELDSMMERKSLNEIEAIKAAALISGIPQATEKIIVDSPDTNAGEFAKRIAKYCSVPCTLIAEHKADFNYVQVSAASVL